MMAGGSVTAPMVSSRSMMLLVTIMALVVTAVLFSATSEVPNAVPTDVASTSAISR